VRLALAERRAAEHIAARHADILPRLELRVCIVMAALVHEFHQAGELFDGQLKEYCDPIVRIGREAWHTLAKIPDTRELATADADFLTAHPAPLVRDAAHPLAAQMLAAWTPLSRYLDRPNLLRSLDDRMDSHLARNAATAGLAANSTHAGNVT
jgi:hypothetical protein